MLAIISASPLTMAFTCPIIELGKNPVPGPQACGAEVEADPDYIFVDVEIAKSAFGYKMYIPSKDRSVRIARIK